VLGLAVFALVGTTASQKEPPSVTASFTLYVFELSQPPRLTIPAANSCQCVLLDDGSEPMLAVVANQYDAESNTASFLLYAEVLLHAPKLLMPTSPCGP
jgi:hypothetical protein